MKQHPDPVQTADQVASEYFGVSDEPSKRAAIRDSLLSVLWITPLIPALFYLRFGEVGPLGLGTTVFFDCYCILLAIGLAFKNRKEYHTPVKLKADWLDSIGAFWMVGCLFGPLAGWFLTTGTIPISAGTWPWLYGGRVLVSAVIPIVLALPLVRYLRGRSVLIAGPILLIVTLLPVSTAVNASRDLLNGPVAKQSTSNSRTGLWLPHTERWVDDPR